MKNTLTRLLEKAIANEEAKKHTHKMVCVGKREAREGYQDWRVHKCDCGYQEYMRVR